MAVRTRLDPIDRDVAVLIDQDLSPEAQSKVLAQFARDNLDDAQETNTRVLGTTPPHDTTVDRVQGAPIDSVRPDGVIVFEFRLVDDVLVWISEQLVRRAPVKTGKFSASFSLFADGAEVDIVDPPAGAQEYVFLNTQPYARKIERGQSPQAPDGIFEAIAVIAGRRFGNTANVWFGFQSPLFKENGVRRRRVNPDARPAYPGRAGAKRVERATRTPAIIVRPR